MKLSKYILGFLIGLLGISQSYAQSTAISQKSNNCLLSIVNKSGIPLSIQIGTGESITVDAATQTINFPLNNSEAMLWIHLKNASNALMGEGTGAIQLNSIQLGPTGACDFNPDIGAMPQGIKVGVVNGTVTFSK